MANKGLDYRNIVRNDKGELVFAQKRHIDSFTPPKRPHGEGLTKNEKTIAWNWLVANPSKSTNFDAFNLFMRNMTDRDDYKKVDLNIVRSYLAYGNKPEVKDAYVNNRTFKTLV